MEFKREIIINRPIGAVWEVLGVQFEDAYKWAASLNHSEGFGTPVLEGATCSNRACDTTQGAIKEKLITLDHEKYELVYQVIEGFPFFVDTAINNWRLTQKGTNTKVNMHCEMKLKGFVGAMMSPLMKLQLNKLFDEVVEELKYYIEHDGKAHPRKEKALAKLAKKAA